ncbi:MAG TPA: hypothetical protein PLE87_19355 [Phycisphaerae bacterium]|nr:hypothetical protein [Phycisphaerae bacterium]
MTKRLLLGAIATTFLLVPLSALAALPEKFPSNTLVYVAWPGASSLKDAFRYTAAARIMAEPEMQRLQEKIWPAIDALVKQNGLEDDEQKTYEQVRQLLQAIYQYPTALALINVDANSIIPLVDAAAVVEAGKDSATLAASLEGIFATAGMPTESIKTVKVGQWKMRELALMGPAMSLRWGVIDDNFVVSFGQKALKHLVPGYLAAPPAPAEDVSDASDEDADTDAPAAAPQPAAADEAKSLTDNPLFKKAMEVTGGSPKLPVIFVNLDQSLHTLEAFQPMLAALGIPVLGEEGGVRKAVGELGLGELRSFTVVWTPDAGGLQVNMFVHAPGMKAEHPPLTDADLKVIPATASWASAAQSDLKRTYDAILRIVEAASPEVHGQVMEVMADIEQRVGMKLGDDLLGSLGDTWVLFDDPQNGSLLFTGTTLVVDVKPDNRIDEALRKLVTILGEETGSEEAITVRDEEYRGQKISYMNFSGIPVPFAPAWTIYEGRCIAALYPQMVRATLNRMMDPQAKTILDNEDFQRGRKLMPAQATSLGYMDTARGVRHLYSIGLPVAQALIAMGQEQGLDLDGSLLPSLETINKHVFATVSGGGHTEDGYVFKSHGAIPASIASLGQTSYLAPIVVSTGVPALTEARRAAKRAVSTNNLHQIGLAVQMYAAQNDGKLPPDLATLQKTGILPESVLKSPLAPDDEEAYIYVGDGLTTDAGPHLPIAYEDPDLHGGYMTNVLFLDGHVEFTTRDRLDELLERVNEAKGESDEDAEEDADDPGAQLKEQQEEEEREERGESRQRGRPAPGAANR